MKKTKNEKLWKRIAACVIAVAIGMGSPTGILRIEAASKPKITIPKVKGTITYPYSESTSTQDDTYTQIRTMGSICFELAKKATIKNVKSSDTDVVEPMLPSLGNFEKDQKSGKMKYITSFYYSLKKVGTATLSFDLKYNGKTYHYKKKIEVIDYENPFESLKVGETDYASQFDKKCYANLKKVSKQKLNIEVKEGWKITKMQIINTDKNTFVSMFGKKGKKVKNGQKISVSGKTLRISLKNKITGTYQAFLHFSNTNKVTKLKFQKNK